MPEGRLERTRAVYQVSPWSDLAAVLWDFRVMILVALVGLLFVGAFVGSFYGARYSECRAHGFSEFYCSMQR